MIRQALWGCAAVALLTAASPAGAAGSRDLTGLWTNESQTGLQRPAGITKLEVSPAEAQKIVAAMKDGLGYTPDENKQGKIASDPNAPPPPAGDKDFGVKAYDTAWIAPGEGLNKVRGAYRTSHLIDPVDGQLPYIDPVSAKAKVAARRVAYETGKGPYDGPENATLGERCILNGSGGPGMLHGLYNNNYQFVLTKDYLGIAVEMGHDVRAIPIYATAQKAKASHGPIPRWQGDSVAWWEGNTLVVESINVNALQLQASASGQFPLSNKAKVTEYLTRTGPKEIDYKFTVDDPANYTKPWTAEESFAPVKAIFEYACSEGNYGLEGMLAGARAKDAEQAAANTPAKRP
jgi:hypothetical protein